MKYLAKFKVGDVLPDNARLIMPDTDTVKQGGLFSFAVTERVFIYEVAYEVKDESKD